MKRTTSNTQRLAIAVIALLTALWSPLQGAVRDQTWPIVVNHSPAQMKVEKSILYMASNDASNTEWAYAGTLQNYQPSKAGLYVGDLDGTGETSIAFYDIGVHRWFHGVINAGQINFDAVEGSDFHVGDGPVIYPIDDPPASTALTLAETGKSSSLPRAAARVTSQSVATPSYAVTAQQQTSLGSSRSMNTTITLFANGLLTAVTKVHNGVWLTGYHGQAQVTLLDVYNRPLISYNSPSIGVTGTAFGHADVTAGWQVQVSNDVVSSAQNASIIQEWNPNFDTIIKDVGPWLNLVLQLEQVLKPILPGK